MSRNNGIGGGAVTQSLGVEFFVAPAVPLPEFGVRLIHGGRKTEFCLKPADASQFINAAVDAYKVYMAQVNQHGQIITPFGVNR